jgi:putative sterol carrier protein
MSGSEIAGGASAVRVDTVGAANIHARLASRVSALEHKPWRVRVALTDAPALVVDCRTCTVVDDGTSESAVDCTLELSSLDLERIISGEMDPRYAFVYSSMKVTGSTSIATRFGDWLAGVSYASAWTAPANRLPVPTRDYDAAWRQLHEFGYALIEGALPPSQLAALRARVLEQAAAEAEAGCADFVGEGIGDEPPPIQRSWSLINKGSEFVELLDHPLIDEFAFKSLGDDCCLGGYWFLIAGPGSGEVIPLHTDQLGLFPPIQGNIGLNMAFALDDFTDANGATRVVPGSHLPGNNIAPADPFSREGTVPMEAPAGSALLFDSRLWHTTGSNRTDTKRHGLFLFFNRQWMRPIENPYFSTHPSVLEGLSDRLKGLYGLRHTNNLGRVGSSRMGDLVEFKPDEIILKMTPSSSASH